MLDTLGDLHKSLFTRVYMSFPSFTDETKRCWSSHTTRHEPGEPPHSGEGFVLVVCFVCVVVVVGVVCFVQ